MSKIRNNKIVKHEARIICKGSSSHFSRKSLKRGISILLPSAISVAVRGERDAPSSRPTPSRNGRGRYILEDCFLSSGSHIRHAKSLEEA